MSKICYYYVTAALFLVCCLVWFDLASFGFLLVVLNVPLPDVKH